MNPNSNDPTANPPAATGASPYAAPEAEPLPESVWDTYTPSGSQTRPWVRYWARTVEVVVFCTLLGALAGFFAPQVLEMNETLLGVVMIGAYRLVEAGMFSAFGTTPGKALMKVRVRRADGARLSFSDALRRSLTVWVKGEGLGIPLISLITHLTAYSRLSQDGITSWDREGRFVVSHRKVAWWRWLVLFALVSGVIYLVVLGRMEDIGNP